jgi:hypothetical protein
LAVNPSYANLGVNIEAAEFFNFAENYNNFKQDVREGKLGKTAQLWLSYSDCVWTLMRFQQSVKENNMQWYLVNQRHLCDLLFSADHLNYARYLPLCCLMLSNLDKTHPGARQMYDDGGLSVARSEVKCCRVPVDQTIEQTINRSAKTRGGVDGFSRSAGAYYRWCLTRHKRANYLEATLEDLDMASNSSEFHKSYRPSVIRSSDTEVTKLVHAFKQYTNPFSIDSVNQQRVYCLSSGLPATTEVEDDLQNVSTFRFTSSSHSSATGEIF